MLFNFIMSETQMFQLFFLSFFIIITIRKLLFKRTFYVLLYYSFITVFVFVIGALGGGSVLNDAHKRLATFKMLEQSNQLEAAKLKPNTYDSLLQIDLKEFANSDAFKKHLHEEELAVNKAEFISVALLLALLTEISAMCSNLFIFVRRVVVASLSDT